MYESYWNLNTKPFDNFGSTDFYYPSDCHQGALLKLRYAVENQRGGAVISGAAGLGKSLLIRTLFAQLPDRIEPRVHIVYPQMPPDQFLAFLADELEEVAAPSVNRSTDISVQRIRASLANFASAGRHPVIAVDEAHLLRELGTLETMRMLLNFEIDDQPAMTLILIGQPTLLTNLDRMTGLEERLGVKCLLRPFTEEETVSYVTHRMKAAGSESEIFDLSALDALHTLSLGIPRRINRLCDLALLVGFAEDLDMITSEQIESVSEELVTVAAE